MELKEALIYLGSSCLCFHSMCKVIGNSHKKQEDAFSFSLGLKQWLKALLGVTPNPASSTPSCRLCPQLPTRTVITVTKENKQKHYPTSRAAGCIKNKSMLMQSSV